MAAEGDGNSGKPAVYRSAPNDCDHFGAPLGEFLTR
jgi:hypothetical protein